LPKDVDGRRVQLLVANRSITPGIAGGWASFRIDTILDHELIVIG